MFVLFRHSNKMTSKEELFVIKVILDKKDLSMVSEDLQNEDILTKQIDMDKVELIVDDGSFDILERIIKKITVNNKAFIFETYSGLVLLS